MLVFSFSILWTACPAPPAERDGQALVVFDVHVEDLAVDLSCEVDEDCYVLGSSACKIARCGKEGMCVFDDEADGSPCTTGDACLLGQTCSAGVCGDGAAKPPCTQSKCGVDSCGNDCGKCGNGFACEAGNCVAVLCDGIDWKGCCTGTNGVRWCDDGQLLEVPCAASESVAKRACGWDVSKGHFDCTAEGSPSPDVPVYLCPGSECPPEPCAGMQCGFSCGQDCGSCAEGWACELGACVEQPIEPDVADVIDEELPSEEDGAGSDPSDTGDSEGPDEDAGEDDVFADVNTPADTDDDAEEQDVEVAEDADMDVFDVNNTDTDNAADGADSSDAGDVNQGGTPG
jgi:hypothetical protein